MSFWAALRRRDVLRTRATCAALLAILMTGALLCALPAHALDPPNHERWQTEMAAAEIALKGGDRTGITAAARGIFEQALRMQNGDPRIQRSAAIMDKALMALQAGGQRADFVAFLRELNELTKVPNGLQGQFGLLPANTLFALALEARDYAAAHALMADAANRATKDFGADHVNARDARYREAEALAAMHDYDSALAILQQMGDFTQRTFGQKSLEHVESIIAVARIEASRKHFPQAIALADQAFALVEEDRIQRSLVAPALAPIYEFAADLPKARDMYQRVDRSLNDQVPAYASVATPALLRLAWLNVELGDAAAGRHYLQRAESIAQNVSRETPGLLIDVLAVEIDLYDRVGEYARAEQILGRLETFIGAAGLADRPETQLRLARLNEVTRRLDRALEIAEALLRKAAPNSADYAHAALMVAFVSAQLVPPRPRIELATSAVALLKKLDPNADPDYPQFVLAKTLEAQGRWRESADLQRQVIAQEDALQGRYATDWRQWQGFAEALDRSGQKEEAARIKARLEDEAAPLRASLRDGSLSVALEEHSALGFDVALTDDRWLRSSKGMVNWPFAAFIAQYQVDKDFSATIQVTPLLLSNGITRDIAIDTLLDTASADRPSLLPWSKGSLAGYETRFTRSNVPGKPYLYVTRLIVTERAIYLVVGSSVPNNPAAGAATLAAMDQVTFKEPVDTEQLTGEARHHHGRLLNLAGTEFARHGQRETALDVWGAARRFDDDVLILQNIALVNLELGRYDVVRDEVDHYPLDPATHPSLLVWRAISHARLGDPDRAIADYRAAFNAGFRDDDAASNLIDLLLTKKATDEAVTFLGNYARAKSTPKVLILQATLALRIGDAQSLEQAMVSLEDPQRSTPEAALAGAVLRYQSDGIEALEALAKRLEAAKLVSPELYLLLAINLARHGKLTGATAAVDAGLTLAPDNSELQNAKRALASKTTGL
jgi:hypothetical protein